MKTQRASHLQEKHKQGQETQSGAAIPYKTRGLESIQGLYSNLRESEGFIKKNLKSTIHKRET